MKILYLLGGIVLGSLILKFTVPIVNTFGRMDWAEKRFGATGTYTVWRFAALACILLGMAIFAGVIPV